MLRIICASPTETLSFLMWWACQQKLLYSLLNISFHPQKMYSISKIYDTNGTLLAAV